MKAGLLRQLSTSKKSKSVDAEEETDLEEHGEIYPVGWNAWNATTAKLPQ
jgi:hypothetical protein